MKKYIFIILTSFLLLVFLSACDSEEQKKQNAAWEAKASENAVSYIEQKYDVSASVISAEVDFERGMFGTKPLSDVLVDMEFKDKEFQVYITGENSSCEGIDSYQADEVETALKDLLDKNLPGVRNVDMNQNNRIKTAVQKPLYSVYYDKGNLSEVLKSGIGAFTAYYLRTDFSDESEFTFLDEFYKGDNAIECTFVSCRTEDFLDFNKIYYRQDPICCDNRRVLNDHESDWYEYKLKEFEDLKYCVTNKHVSSDDDVQINFIHTEKPDVSVFEGRGASEKAQPASKAYSVRADKEVKIYVYTPVCGILNYDKGFMHNDTRIGLIHYNFLEQEDSIGSYSISDVGDYAREEFNIGPLSGEYTFMYLYDPD